MNTTIQIRKKGKSLIKIPSRFVVFDIETTGLNPATDEIIEISAIKVRDNVIEDTFSYLIKPNNEIPYFITELTKITNEMVENAPSIEEVLPKFLDLLLFQNSLPYQFLLPDLYVLTYYHLFR